MRTLLWGEALPNRPIRNLQIYIDRLLALSSSILSVYLSAGGMWYSYEAVFIDDSIIYSSTH
jgi:hypothetical protein